MPQTHNCPIQDHNPPWNFGTHVRKLCYNHAHWVHRRITMTFPTLMRILRILSYQRRVSDAIRCDSYRPTVPTFLWFLRSRRCLSNAITNRTDRTVSNHLLLTIRANRKQHLSMMFYYGGCKANSFLVITGTSMPSFRQQRTIAIKAAPFMAESL